MRELTAPERCDLYDLKECPFCHGVLFFEGPRGGQAVNWYCANAACGAGFNLSPEPFRHGQLIHEPKTPNPNWSPAEGAEAASLNIAMWPSEGARQFLEDHNPSELDRLDREFGQPHHGHGHDEIDEPTVVGSLPTPSEYLMLADYLEGVARMSNLSKAACQICENAAIALRRAEHNSKLFDQLVVIVERFIEKSRT